MKLRVKTLIALLVCFCVCINLVMPVLAAGENNAEGITFSAETDTPSMNVSTTEQTIVVSVDASNSFSADGIGFNVIVPEGFTLVSVSNEDVTFSGADVNLANGVVGWSSQDSENVTGISNLAVITYTIPAGTGSGEYIVGVEAIELTKDYGTVWESAATATTTLTITEAAGYTAGLNTLTSEVAVGDQITVNIGVAHVAEDTFAAGEIIVNYNSDFMKFNEVASSLGTATVKANTGSIILEDYGADKNFGTGVYVLVFDAIAAGDAAVSITSAAFVNKIDAVKSDLINADLSPVSVSLKINKQIYSVTLPGIFSGPETVTDGDDYTFSVADGVNYEYDSISATIAGEPVNVIDNGDGTYTLKNVTGTIVITGSRTEKSYSVSVSGNAADEITDAANIATYNTDYTFTMPAAEGWAYSLDSITIGGVTYTGYSVENSVYTIAGSAINGDIVITVSKNQTIASVTVEGTGAGAAAGYKTSADIGAEYTLTIVPEAGYTYTVSATINGVSLDVTDNGDNTYTVSKVLGNIVFVVNCNVVLDGVSVSQYLSLDGSIMWLIKNDTKVANGKVPTYDDEKMFWSEEYGCYCYLTVAETLTVEETAAKVSISEGSAVSVSYEKDVNLTGRTDASDAQLVYNMYNAYYDAISADVTVEKFLRADVNADGIINVEDAASIIASILG